jgi:hypothetical protein
LWLRWQHALLLLLRCMQLGCMHAWQQGCLLLLL